MIFVYSVACKISQQCVTAFLRDGEEGVGEGEEEGGHEGGKE